MKLKTVYARFYKSFNFDHQRKADQRVAAKEWETFRGVYYPYIEVPIEREITTVVGANESGKTHLLSAIKKTITGKGIEQRDLCRFSPFFNVEKGQECWPHLGVAWAEVTPDEVEKLRTRLTGGPQTFDRFLMFRERPDDLTIYIPVKEGEYHIERFKGDDAQSFGQDILPQPFEIHPSVALPNAIPLTWLVTDDAPSSSLTSRRAHPHLIDIASRLADHWQPTERKFQENAPGIYSSLSPYFNPGGKLDEIPEDEEPSTASLELARNLLLRLAMVDPNRVKNLQNATAVKEDGYANALVNSINDQLAKRLNFPKWWVQDRDFSLCVTLQVMELVFTIKDRTGTDYSFKERSNGLRYFLSYLIQSQARERLKDRPEILLMDEPDAFLSAEGQQDLLKIFDDCARPSGDVAPVQVVFVTHSPFLIDKNHAERIRVLEKGKSIDGTRVIRNASQNHYEPLRSAFGAYVGETAFIGACNLLLEGVADQVLLAGAARLTRNLTSSEYETLDLNRLVLVPCGSASLVPYMVYLIRGRDTEKPPVIALLDADPAGLEAANLMRQDDAKMKR